MARFEAEREHSLDEVLSWFQRQLDSLNERDRELSRLMREGRAPEDYRYLTPSEVEQQFERDRHHLRNAGMLLLLTATEALLRLDFEEYAQRKIKPGLFREFRRAKRERGEKVRLVEDILDTWTAVLPETAAAIREFKGVIPLRDWLAHGRYWTPRLGRPWYSVNDVYDIADEMLSRMRDAY